MANSDATLNELDARIAWLKDELRKASEFRAWVRGWGPLRAPFPVDEDPDKAPTTKTWIRRALAGGNHLTGAQIATAAVNLGWATSSKNPSIVVRNALRDMLEKGEVRREGKLYSLPPALMAVQDAMDL